MLWIIETLEHESFPYRLTIRQDEKTVLRLRLRSRWPGAGSQVFCLREDEPPELGGVEVERVPIVSLDRYGKRLAVVLDRPTHKRCDFLFLKKPFKTKPGEYEQIFWRTPEALRARKSRARLTARGESDIRIAVDIRERYGWSFPGCAVERRSLPAGDYALVDESGIVAIVERKTLPNLLDELRTLPLLHQRLGELERYAHPAVVIEGAYADFLSPAKTRVYSPAYMTKVLAELAAFHPKLPIVFAGNRKLGREWTLRFFHAVQSHREDRPAVGVAEAAAAYEPGLPFAGGRAFEFRKRLVSEFPEEFAWRDIQAAFPDIAAPTLRNYLTGMRREGLLECRGRGRLSTWVKTERFRAGCSPTTLYPPHS
jgi:hypothetical protein